MDEETRFLLVSEMSKTREIEDVRKAFRKAKERARGRPEVIKTDGLWQYIKLTRRNSAP
jgi:transposase-like protein